MRLLHWCILGVTILMLMCEITISQLCKSLITLINGFHTLFILTRMAVRPPKPEGISTLSPSSLDSSTSPHASSSSTAPPSTRHTDPSIKPQPGTHTATDGSSTHQLWSCGVSFSSTRIQAAEAFISSLFLVSLCVAYLIQIIIFSVEPKPVRRPLLLVVMGSASLLHKILVIGLNWDQLWEDRARITMQRESHLEVNHKVLAEEKTKGLTEQVRGQVLNEVSQVQSAVEDSLHNGALVLCNPGTSSIPDTDSTQQPEVHSQAAAPGDNTVCEVESDITELKAFKSGSLTKSTTDESKNNINMGQDDSQSDPKTTPVCKSSRQTESPVSSCQRSDCLLSVVLIIQGLFTATLALINSLLNLLVGPYCQYSSKSCSLLVYLDPSLSVLAVIALGVIAVEQMHRYGLLLLQSTPPHISVSDLRRRITSVPGVLALHDFHVWQLSESFTVATVHVHCRDGFPAHRCAELLMGVTKVLQSVGVSCCTVQPEFASNSGCSAASECGSKDHPVPPLPACSLACQKACSSSMCCSVIEETQKQLAPPAGEAKEEPQSLIIENTFH